MKNRFTLLVLILALLATLCGCGEIVGDIADSVADAAMKELEQEIQEALETYSVNIIEIKSAVGKLNNDSDSNLQFFCGVLVRSNSDKFPMSGADAIGKFFEQAGCQQQLQSRIHSDLLKNKDISFKHDDFSTGDYYLIWFYSASITDKLTEINLPTFPEGWKPADGARENEAGVG